MGVATRAVHDFTTGEAPADTVWDSLAKGYQLIATVTSTVSSIGGSEITVTDTSPTAPTFTALTSRVFEIAFAADVLGTNAGDLAQVRVLIDGSVAIDDLTAWVVVRTDNYVTCGKSYIMTLAAGAHTIELQCARKAGSGTLSCAASSHVTVKDVGSL